MNISLLNSIKGCRLVWHGSGRNRFYDKLQFIVSENGIAGLNGEHSMVDGTPCGNMSEFIFKFKHTGESSRLWNTTPAKKIHFQWSSSIIDNITRSTERFDKLAQGHKQRVVQWKNYGKKFISGFGLSPDAFVQLAFQLGYFNLLGRVDPVYESGMTRKFLHGRTETIRSVSVESVQWVKAMTSHNIGIREKFNFLKNASIAHVNYAKLATNNHGCDRHLFGLYNLCIEHGMDLPSIFRDPTYERSRHWNISTSQMSSDGYIAGFGEVVEDGFGLCYCIRNDEILVTMASDGTNPNTDIDRYWTLLNEAFLSMKTLCEANKSSL